ncbi:MAG: GAF domain-containing protein, partial [Deltaproteobacteria bacterium]|nr:GAF domain-containing protein [Deltaproteobacteria bacterium]
RLPMGVGLAGWVAKAGQPLNLRDVYQDKRFNKAVDQRTGYRTQNMLAFPMRDHRGNVLGVIQALNKKVGGGFSDEDERTLEAVSSQAAAAIENAMLYSEALARAGELTRTRDELARKLAEMDLLFEFTQTLARARDAREMVQLVLGRASTLIGSEGAALMRLDGPQALLDLYVASDTPEPAVSRSFPTDPNEGVPGWIIRHAQAVIIGDLAKDKRHAKAMAKRWDVTLDNVCGVPLLASDGGCSGALVLFNRDPVFSEEHVVLLTMLANHVAKALEAARIKEQDQNALRLQTIGQMLSGVVHDFKTPMTIISGYVQLMESSDAKEERQEYAELVLKQFENLSQMTKELLQFAKGEVEVFLHKVYLQQFIAEVDEVLKHLFENSPVDYVLETRFKGTVRMDAGKMLRVVTNIARNAKEAMPEGGKFKFTVEQSGESVLLVMADNGPGIAEELEGRLFTEFATHGKADGTGLGLAVVKRIVQQHHGDISYESRRGKGTTFTVRLPL